MKVSELEVALYPGLDIKAFNRDQKTEAEAWINAKVCSILKWTTNRKKP